MQGGISALYSLKDEKMLSEIGYECMFYEFWIIEVIGRLVKLSDS